MTVDGEYAESPWKWVRDQVETYEKSAGEAGNTLLDTGIPIIVVTMRGHRTGAVRKVPLMRVEHDGAYALIASMGGAPKNPLWYANLKAGGDVTVQDGAEPCPVEVREVTGVEREEWFDRGIAIYPPYADYQARTERTIPVFVATPRR